MAPWLAAFALYALCVALFTNHDDRVWGAWAVGAYAVAAVVSWLSSSPTKALALAAAGALAAPLAWLAAFSPATADVEVVGRGAVLLLRHGTPYLPLSQLTTWRSYNPYLPAMSLLGVPHAAGIPGLAGNPGVWQALASVAIFALAFRVAAPHRPGNCPDCRRISTRATLFAAASPVVAFPATLGITDPTVLALLCLALAYASRTSGAWRAGVILGIASAMKITAWPAVPVLAAMLAVRDGPRAVRNTVAATAATAVIAIFVTAPALLAHPTALFENVVLFPLSLTRHKTPAQSPLPGHLLAGLGPGAHLLAVGLLLGAGLALAVSVLLRPPRDLSAVAWRLALGLSLMFALAPAARFGYFAYPLGLLAWVRLTRPDTPYPRAVRNGPPDAAVPGQRSGAPAAAVAQPGFVPAQTGRAPAAQAPTSAPDTGCPGADAGPVGWALP